MSGDMRERNRAEYPTLAGVMDDFRKMFGPGVKLLHGQEPDGREVGKVPDYMPRGTPPSPATKSEGEKV